MKFKTAVNGMSILFGFFTMVGSCLMFLVMFLAASYADQTGTNPGLLMIGLCGQIGFVILAWESLKYINEDRKT